MPPFNQSDISETKESFAPSVSVIMSVYNGEQFLREAVQSILDQSFTNFELIVVDDGSTDTSLEVLQSYADVDRRVKIISRVNKGLIASLNEAAGRAVAPLLARMDGDDVAHPNRFQAQVQEFNKRPNLVALGSQVRFVGADGLASGKTLKYPVGQAEVKDNHCRGGPFVAHPSLMMRTSVFKLSGGYRAPFVAAEDLDLLYRLFELGEIDNLNGVFLDYRFHGKNISIVGGYKQMLTRAVLIELVEAKAKRGVDYLSKLKGAIDIDTIENQTGYLGLRDRLVARLVDRGFTYNHHAVLTNEGFGLLGDRLKNLSISNLPVEKNLRFALIWTTLKTIVRTKNFSWLLKLLALAFRSGK